MLKLRKLLLCDYLFILLILLVLLSSIPRLSNNHKILNTNRIQGKVINKSIQKNKIVLTIKSKEKILATYYKDTNIDIGDKVLIEGELSIPKNNSNENTFNYKKYLNNKNIYYIMKIKTIKRIKSNKNIYYSIKRIIKRRLNNNPYLYTFILGDKSLIEDDVKKSFQENGISHLMAISGMHITLFSMLILKLLNLFHFSEEKSYVITIVFLVLYLLLVGLSPSILRGVLFYIIFSFNRIYYFYIKPVNLYIVVLSISILINPKYIFDISFQYSYLISLSLIVYSDRLQNSNYFISLFKVSLISFISSIPITLLNYYQVNLLSIIYNLFFVPLVSIIIFPLSLLCLIIPKLSIILNIFTIILENTSIYLNKISIFKLTFMKVNIIIYFLYLILIILFLITNRKSILLTIILIISIHYIQPYLNKSTYINIIDVGQGDSTLIHLKSKSILVDTGGKISDSNESLIVNNTLLPIFKSKGIIKINYLVITHGDFDHMGEAINLVNNFKVDKVIFNCGEFNDLEQELIKVLEGKKIPYYSCIEELNIDSIKLYFLQTKEYDNENDNSNVIYTEINGYKFMFMGDAGVEKERNILDEYNISDIDVLKVGHHGSKTSSSESFINEMNPRYSIISVGKNNRYGHPNKEVLDTLEKSKIYRTDIDGSIMFKIKNNKLRVKTCKP